MGVRWCNRCFGGKTISRGWLWWKVTVTCPHCDGTGREPPPKVKPEPPPPPPSPCALRDCPRSGSEETGRVLDSIEAKLATLQPKTGPPRPRPEPPPRPRKPEPPPNIEVRDGCIYPPPVTEPPAAPPAPPPPPEGQIRVAAVAADQRVVSIFGELSEERIGKLEKRVAELEKNSEYDNEVRRNREEGT